jgi:uncharacterized membrane protein
MYPFFPFIARFSLFFVFLLIFLFVMIEIDVVGYAFQKIGINHRYVFLILILTFLGSSINIPVAHIPGETVVVQEPVHHFGMRFFIPQLITRNEITIAVNLGGAVIPTLLSLFLLLRLSHPSRALIAVAIVAAVSYHFATLIKGAGIAVPTFIPPITAALCAFTLAKPEAPLVAYIAGSMGTLIGADLLNLGRLSSLGSPFVSIGGAGTFDGIFLSSIIAVLLV